MKNADRPMNPVEVSGDGEGNIQGMQTGNYSGWETGLTKREYFAGLAMQALISNPNIKRPVSSHIDDGKESSDFSKVAIEYADSLLKELETQLD